MAAICHAIGFDPEPSFSRTVLRRGAAHLVMFTGYTVLVFVLVAWPMLQLSRNPSLSAALLLAAALVLALVSLWRLWPAFGLVFGVGRRLSVAARRLVDLHRHFAQHGVRSASVARGALLHPFPAGGAMPAGAGLRRDLADRPGRHAAGGDAHGGAGDLRAGDPAAGLPGGGQPHLARHAVRTPSAAPPQRRRPGFRRDAAPGADHQRTRCRQRRAGRRPAGCHPRRRHRTRAGPARGRRRARHRARSLRP
ncbi:hypothetical protein RLIN73S_02680 [Rhodanobacter lindaniclasticus]